MMVNQDRHCWKTVTWTVLGKPTHIAVLQSHFVRLVLDFMDFHKWKLVKLLLVWYQWLLSERVKSHSSLKTVKFCMYGSNAGHIYPTVLGKYSVSVESGGRVNKIGTVCKGRGRWWARRRREEDEEATTRPFQCEGCTWYDSLWSV